MRLDTVLCPIDFTPVSGQELGLAAQLCERLGASLVLQHNLATVAGLGVSWMHEKEHWSDEREQERSARERMREVVEGLPEDLRGRTRATLTYGSFEHSLLHLAGHVSADLIVMSTHGRSSGHHTSATEHVVTHAPCAVLTTHAGSDAPPLWALEAAPIRTIVPVDFTDHSVRALHYALALRERLPIEIALLYVATDRGGDLDWAERRLAEVLPAEHRGTVHVDLTRGGGRPVDEILLEEMNLDARLVIAGSHERGLIERLVTRGPPTATELLHRSLCPVWFVPAGAALA